MNLKEKDMLLKELGKITSEKPSQELFEFMEANIISFFSTPDIPVYYDALKNADITVSKKTLPKLIIAWMAFLCGDHSKLFFIMNDINETSLEEPQESSMFYALKGMIGYMMDQNEGLKYAKMSLNVLPKDEKSFYLGNAKLTYGQLLSSSHQYRLAAEMFAASAEIFYSLNLYFLSVISMVNEALNRYKLGEFTHVIDKCNEALLMSGSFKEETHDYWKLVHLPLGMCYYELNKPNLATEHLKIAKENIDQFSLFHMHGLIELFLFKSYYSLNNKSAMEEIKDETSSKFQHMNYPQTDLLISMFKIFTALMDNDIQIQSDIEKLEFEYLKDGANSHSVVIEVLSMLKVKGLSDAISTEDLEKRLERFRYTGFIPQIQITLLQIAEIHYYENRQKQAINYLNEAVKLYKEFGISGCFCTLSLNIIELLKKIDIVLYNSLKRSIPNKELPKLSVVLTSREREIMKWISLGKSNEEISKVLFISVGTIKWHINNIFGKLEVKNRVQAVEKVKKIEKA